VVAGCAGGENVGIRMIKFASASIYPISTSCYMDPTKTGSDDRVYGKSAAAAAAAADSYQVLLQDVFCTCY
jgi:hypothetical protein